MVHVDSQPAWGQLGLRLGNPLAHQRHGTHLHARQAARRTQVHWLGLQRARDCPAPVFSKNAVQPRGHVPAGLGPLIPTTSVARLLISPSASSCTPGASGGAGLAKMSPSTSIVLPVTGGKRGKHRAGGAQIKAFPPSAGKQEVVPRASGQQARHCRAAGVCSRANNLHSPGPAARHSHAHESFPPHPGPSPRSTSRPRAAPARAGWHGPAQMTTNRGCRRG